MSNLIKEFKEFAMKGNVVDMAVGVIIGAAFGKIVTSLVADLFMPVLGILVGGVDFSQMKVILRAAEGTQAEVALRYGAFFQTVFDFLIVAWAIFMAIKVLSRLKKAEPAPASGAQTPPPPSADIVLLTEIRDLLRRK